MILRSKLVDGSPRYRYLYWGTKKCSIYVGRLWKFEGIEMESDGVKLEITVLLEEVVQ